MAMDRRCVQGCGRPISSLPAAREKGRCSVCHAGIQADMAAKAERKAQERAQARLGSEWWADGRPVFYWQGRYYANRCGTFQVLAIDANDADAVKDALRVIGASFRDLSKWLPGFTRDEVLYFKTEFYRALRAHEAVRGKAKVAA